MKKIIGVEAQRFIPVPMDTVKLDWITIPDESAEVRAFDQLADKKGIQARTQKVLLVASENIAANARMKAVHIADIVPSFGEVEMFSITRACKSNVSEPSLIIDMGATTTKLYIADERGMPIAAHVLQTGGNETTRAIAAALGWETTHAEEAKRAYSSAEGANLAKKERDVIAKLLAQFTADVFTVARGMIDTHAEHRARRITHIIVSGGGAEICIPEVREHIHKKFAVEVSRAEPFTSIKRPMILDETIQRVGPRFTVAVGLALRALYSS